LNAGQLEALPRITSFDQRVEHPTHGLDPRQVGLHGFPA
jgi:hypothetical protein